MRLVIREYLSMLKEDDELDTLLADLLLAMQITPLSRPLKGTRQDGVDIPAVGKDPEDKSKKLFLFTVKQGNITRSEWDKSPNGVRPSLNEIMDGYLRNRVRSEHSGLTKKIVLVCGGELKQNVAPNWTNYTDRNAGENADYGSVEFDLWDGDKLALLIERYFLDEYLFPESARKQIRKTIALADQNEEEPRHFYALAKETLLERDLPSNSKTGSKRKRRHALLLLNLSLNIVFHWCQEANNLRPALLCAERALLTVWDWIRDNDLFVCKATMEEFERLFSTYIKIENAYVIKLLPFCFVRDSLFGHGADEVEYPLRTFEVIGFFSLLSLTLSDIAEAIPPDNPMHQTLAKEAQAVAKALWELIQHNPASKTPRYDRHAIEIGLGLLALKDAGLMEQASEWVEELSGRILFAYKIGRHFPIATDSYDDLVAMSVGQAPSKEKLMNLSTLLPMLAHWYVVLDRPTSYKEFQAAVSETFADTNLQLWYPDADTDGFLYRSNAARNGGTIFSSIRLPETLPELKAQILRVHKERQEYESLSCIKHGRPILALIASRHFKTPVVPAYWQHLVDEAADSESDQNTA